MHWKHDSLTSKNLSQALINSSIEETNSLFSAINKYNSSRIRKNRLSGEVVWSQNSTSLLKYQGSGHAVLIIPSLINTSNILDLSDSKSFLRNLANNDLQPYLLDWGEVGNVERNYGLEDYINNAITPAIDYLFERHGKITLIGYCMGGFLSLASSVLNKEKLSNLVLISTPWDFKPFNFTYNKSLNKLIEGEDIICSDTMRLVFYYAAPFSINRKYIDFGNGKFDEEKFLEIENWSNSSIPMSKKVFDECFLDMIPNNTLYENKWAINNTIIDPKKCSIPIKSVIFTKDKIVPLQSAKAFLNANHQTEVLEINSGHIGPIIDNKYKLATKLADWIHDD